MFTDSNSPPTDPKDKNTPLGAREGGRMAIMRYAIAFLFICALLAITGYRAYRKYHAVSIPQRIELSITIPEGWTAQEIATYLDQQGITSQKEFEDVIGPDATSTLRNEFPFLKEIPQHTGDEGYLFPDTYRFYTGTSATQVAIKMFRNFNVKFSDDFRQETSRQHRTIFQIITMASLIEKETANDHDREIVAGILWKRLANNMPLQVDATVAYITGEKTTKISHGETEIDSPYNTYRYPGLPKGPIANPGIAAIRAALYPKKSPYLYYLSTPDGKIIFSRTLEEHNLAKARYLK